MQNRRYLGMTVAQLGILAGLAVAACLVCGLTGALLLGGASPLASDAPEMTQTVQPTSTIALVPTVTPTFVPSPVPYDQLIPNGWTQHRTALAEVWLPSTFKDAKSNAGTVISGNSIVLEMELTAPASSSSVYRVTVTVAYEPLTGASLDGFIDSRLAGIPPEVNLAERREVFVNGAQAQRLMFESLNNGIYVNDLMYVFPDGGTVWYVRYSAQINDFYELLLVFEDSAKTFRVAG